MRIFPEAEKGMFCRKVQLVWWGMNYPAASCEVSNPRWRVAMARQFGGEILGAACTA